MSTQKLIISLTSEITEWARENLQDEIDTAYEYFWEEEYPEDYLTEIALEIGFLNFGDWLLFDRPIKDEKGLIDIYIEAHPELSPKKLSALNKMKASVISLYEVVSVGEKFTLKNLLFEEEIQGEAIKGLLVGDVFATRFIPLNKKPLMSFCVYPFGSRLKNDVIGYINKQYERYKKNEAPEGTLREFLKKHSDVFNTIWYSELFGKKG